MSRHSPATILRRRCVITHHHRYATTRRHRSRAITSQAGHRATVGAITATAVIPVIAIRRVTTITVVQADPVLRGAMVMVMAEATAVPAEAVDVVTVEAVEAAMVEAGIGR